MNKTLTNKLYQVADSFNEKREKIGQIAQDEE